MTFADRVEKTIITGKAQHATPSDLRVLEIYELCNRYHCLPESGGLFDQDPELMSKFRIIDAAMNKKSDLDRQYEEMKERAKSAQPGGL
jgi:hypothetical protein